MKMLLNTVSKVVSAFFGPWMRPLVWPFAARAVRSWAPLTLRRPSIICYPNVRHLQTSRVASVSVADRIKQFLPEEATEEDEADSIVQTFQIYPDNAKSGLNAFSAEIREIDILVTQGKLALACKKLLQELPLHVVLSALIDHMVPLVSQSPISDLGIYEIAFHLHVLDQSALASQLLQSVFPAEFNETTQLCEFEIVRRLSERSWTSQEIDLVVQEHANMYFPQILQSRYSRWLKTRLLASLKDKDFEISFKRWNRVLIPVVGPSGIALLVTTNRSTTIYNIVKVYVFQLWEEHYVNALVRATNTDEGFSRTWWQLRKRLNDHAHISSDPVFHAAVPSLLKIALKLKKSYELASICYYGAAQLEEHPNLVAKALLAAAFAQKRPAKPLDSFVSASKQELQTFLVKRVLVPVIDDPIKYDRVVAQAAARLREVGMPSRVFWRLMLSLPTEATLGPRSSRELAPIACTRPYVEQLRYMALPVVPNQGVYELLRLNIDRMVAYRRINRVPETVPQSQEDINLLITGMVLASEKIMNADPSSQERELAKMIHAVFESWQGDEATHVLKSAVHSNKTVASTIVQQIIRVLVLRKAYKVALQVLRLVEGPQRPATLELLLLSIAKDTPAKSYAAISWLVSTANIPIPSFVLNKVLLQLCETPLLTETQLKNQFQGIRRLMLVKLDINITSAAAKALVEVLINSAIVHRRGSRTRLQWALDVAKRANVSKHDFAKWTHKLETMQQNEEGYWAV